MRFNDILNYSDAEQYMDKETIILRSEPPLPSVQPRNEDKILLPTSVSPLPLVQPPGSCLQVQEGNEANLVIKDKILDN